jgi:hypothetical protein
MKGCDGSLLKDTMVQMSYLLGYYINRRVNFSPTWKNFRIGKEAVEKILDRFMVSEDLLETRICILNP